MLVALGLLVASCGGGQPQHAASQPEFAGQYSALNADYRVQLQGLQDRGRAALATGGDAVVATYEALLTATEDIARRHHALTPPPGLSDDFGEVVAAIDAQVDALRDVLDAARGNDRTRLGTALGRYASALSNWTQARQRLETALGSPRAGPTG